MKKLFIILLCSSITIVSHAQQKAVTEKGDEVILYENGSWKYVNDLGEKDKVIPTNPKIFKKSNSSTFLLKSAKFDIGVWLDPKKWSFEKPDDNSAAEYELQLKDEDLYAMMITEKVEIPLETLRGIAIENAQEVAPDLQIVKEEYRVVNGLKVLLMQMNGTMKGIKFSYYGYYFTNSKGTIQFVTYTAQNLLSEYKSVCEEILNGLVEIK